MLSKFELLDRLFMPNSALRAAIFVFSVFLFAITPVFLTPILPVIDFYSHAGRVYLLSRDVLGIDIGEHYHAAWELVPNLAGDLLALPFYMMLPPENAARAQMILTAAVSVGGVLYLNKSIHGSVSAVNIVAGCILIFNYTFFWGFSNYLLALGLSFWAIAFWVRMRERSLVAAALGATAIGVGLFYSHAYAFGTYGVVLAAYEIGRAYERGRDRGFIACFDAAAPLLALFATAIPVLFLFARSRWSQENNRSIIDSVLTRYTEGTLFDRAAELAATRLSILFRQVESPFLSVDIIFNSGLIFLASVALWRGWIHVPLRWRFPFLGVATLFVVTPSAIMSINYVPDRLPTLAAYLFVGTTQVTGNYKAVLAVSSAFLTFRTVLLAWLWSSYAPYYQDLFDWADRMPPGKSMVMLVGYDTDRRVDPMPRCNAMVIPFLWRARAQVPIFAQPGVHILEIRGELAEIVSKLKANVVFSGPSNKERYQEAFSGIGETGADYVITCHQRYVGRPPDDKFRSVFENQVFNVYEIVNEEL